MSHDHYSDELIRSVLNSVQTIALVGASPNATRPSHGVMSFLLRKGYHVIPVNPGQAGKEILGQTVFASLADISEPIDMIDVFRAADQLPALVEEVLALPEKPKDSVSVIYGNNISKLNGILTLNTCETVAGKR